MKLFIKGPITDAETLRKVHRVRYEVYAEECGFEPENTERYETDTWDDCSEHFAAFDRRQNVVGTVRLVQDNGYGLPVDHEEGLTLDPQKRYERTCLELSRFAVLPAYRLTKASGMLLDVAFRYCLRNGYDGLVFVTDHKIINSYKTRGYDIEVLSNSAFLHGRDRAACLAHITPGILDVRGR